MRKTADVYKCEYKWALDDWGYAAVFLEVF